MYKKQRIIIPVVMSSLALCLGAGPLYAGEDAALYKRARQFTRQGNKEFAFMNYRSIFKDYPGSRFWEEALFANAEYYSILSKEEDARALFEEYIKTSTDADARFFALVHLWKMAERKGDQAQLARLTSQIASNKQISFIFRDQKEMLFRSPLARQYRAVIQIDKIKIFLEGVLFAEILYTD